jgi:hypothetical protein
MTSTIATFKPKKTSRQSVHEEDFKAATTMFYRRCGFDTPSAFPILGRSPRPSYPFEVTSSTTQPKKALPSKRAAFAFLSYLSGDKPPIEVEARVLDS